MGLVLPAVTFLKIFKKEKELFSVGFSMQYGSLYLKYHFRKGFFTTIEFAKLAVIAIWVGLLYEHPVSQLIMLAVTHIVSCTCPTLVTLFDLAKVYFVIILIGKPHADHIHFFTELVVTVLQVVMFLFFLGFRNKSDASGWAIGVVVVHILAVSVIVVGICSTLFKMNGITTISELRDSVSGRDKNKGSEATTGLQKAHRVSSSPSPM